MQVDFFNPRSIICFIAILQGLIFAGMLIIRGFRQKNKADFWLAILLLTLCSALITPFIGFANVYDLNQWLTYFPFSIAFSSGVLVWFYTLFLTDSKRKFQQKDLLVFLPTAIYLIFRFYLFSHDLEWKDWFTYSYGRFSGKVIFVAEFIWNVTFLYFSIRHYRKYRAWLNENYSDTEKIKFDWLRNFLYIFTFILILGGLFDFTNSFIFYLSYIQFFYFEIVLSLATYYLAVAGYLRSKTIELHFTEKEAEKIEERKTLLSESELEKLKNRLEKLMQNDKVYLEPNLTLTDLSRQLGVNSTVLSFVINNGFDKNFNDFVNEFRITDVKEKLKNVDDSTLLSVAFDCGFNSKATFNRAFKNLQEFRQKNSSQINKCGSNHHKIASNYDLRRFLFCCNVFLNQLLTNYFERNNMKKLFFTAICAVTFLSTNTFSQSKIFFQTIAGNWEGTLEYQDYSENKRVKLKTYLMIKPSTDGESAEITTVYDDFGRIIKDVETEKIDLAAKKFTQGNFSYQIESAENGKIVLIGSGQDGNTVEPIRKTITFDENSLVFLKETRQPWQFRNQLTLKRTNENVLAKKTFSPAQLKEDFDVFKKILIAIHPGIYRYNTPEGLEKEFAELEAKLKNPLTEGEVFVLFSQFTEKIKCGHTYANPYNQNGLVRERLFGGKTYLPFYFRIINGKIIVTENASTNGLSKGSEITKINGVAVKQIIAKLLTVTKADGNSTKEHRLNSLELTRFEAERYALFDLYFPLFYPLKDEKYSIEAVDFATKKKTNFQVSAMTKDERKDEMTKRYGKSATYDDGWKFEIQGNSTAYLKIDNSITWRLRKVKFKEFLANAFAEIRTKNIKNLIIDLRGNGGGDMDVGYELSRYLAKEKLGVYAESKRFVRNVAAQKDLAKYLDTYSDELKFVLQNGVPATSFTKFDERYFEIIGRENYPAVEPYKNNFNGKAFIIADSSNASATFQFLDYVKTNRLAKIVGQTTGGNKQGINGGNYFFLNLPNSRVEIDIPVYFQAPLKQQKDESVIPNVVVKKGFSDVGNNFDREVFTIKKLIKK